MSDADSLYACTLRNLSQIFKTEGFPWKVLILDDVGKSILAPLFSVGKLRMLGVSLTMDLKMTRTAVPDAAAIYFIQSTPENLALLAQDIRSSRYGNYFIDFVEKIEDEALTKLIDTLNNNNANFSINRVFERYISYLIEKKNVFTLGLHDALPQFYFNQGKDELIEDTLNSVVKGLVSVCINLGEIPIVHFPNNSSPASLIGTKLVFELTKLFTSGECPNSLQKFTNNSASAVPSLVILNRSDDFVPLFAHSWTYDQLIFDLLDKKSNFVMLDSRKYDLSEFSDSFIAEHQYAKFPDVAASCSEQLNAFSEKMSLMKSQNLEGDSKVLQNKLNSTLTNASSILQDKTNLDKHTAVCNKLLQKINERSIDKYAILASILRASNKIKSATAQQLNALAEEPNDEDFLRICMVAELACGESAVSFINELCSKRFKEIPDVLIRFRSLCKANDHRLLSSYPSSTANLATPDSNDSASKLFDSVLGRGVDLLKQIIPATFVPPFQHLLNKFLYKGTIDAFHSESPTGITEHSSIIICFVIGGASYEEIGVLQSWADKQNVKLIYGTTAFTRPCDVLSMLCSKL